MAETERTRRRTRLVVANGSYVFLVATLYTAVTALIAGDPWDWGRFWLWSVVVGTVAVVSGGVQVLADRDPLDTRPKSAEDETAQAMRTGVLPSGADQDIWRGRVQRAGRTATKLGVLSSILCLVTAVATALAAHLRNDDDPVLWAMAVIALLLLAPLLGLMVQLRRRRQRLLAQL
ncbi:hypothetical protein O2W14_09825 [Modestobacter sp. VKM Ac-2986]|uniref:hypothetical protein n=1 Tax=Modestobacter sp. VKM Ac-2986 TaxID=3004140 RepID=UPI0022AA4076|nr:hypothetical protein [Modestobacter sp. VKM Ac-2986]MCZ2829132.1 hypothetical protein [Modestobacter sp. VKM Ac-2986]